jgi:hypothetical protein
MRKLRTSLLVASFVSVLGACYANAGVQTGSYAQTDTQIKWEKYRAGWTWDQNQTFMDELRLSLKQFFGNSIGAYFEQLPESHHRIPLSKWALISTQFLDNQRVGNYGKGTILNGQWELYEFSDGTAPLTAWVTPVNSTTVVAAAINGSSCGLVKATVVADPAAFKKRFTNPDCFKPLVTIFFKDKFSYNKAIRNVLIRQMSQDLIRDCNHDLTHTPGADSYRFYVAKHGHPPPPCRIPWKVVTLNELPQE